MQRFQERYIVNDIIHLGIPTAEIITNLNKKRLLLKFETSENTAVRFTTFDAMNNFDRQ